MAYNSPILNGDISGGLHTTSVDKLKGQPVSGATPEIGQVLQYNGTTWTPGAIPNGGSGGGGLTYYLNQSTAAAAPTTGLTGTPYQLGRVGDAIASTVTSGALSQTTYDLIASFVTDVGDPGVLAIPGGIWDFNIWASSNANASNQTIFQIKVYKYNGTTPTLLGTSDDVYVYDPTVSAQYIASVTLAKTTLLATDRIVVELLAKGSANNRTITFDFGDGKPAHVHTTLPAVAGTGLVKTINGVMQSPASLLVDADVAANAAIAQSKINGLVTALDGKQASLTSAAPLDLTKGGIAAIYGSDTRMTGTLLPATIRHNSNLIPDILGTGTFGYTNGSTTVAYSVLSAGVQLVPGMSLNVGALQAFVIRSIDTGTGASGSSGNLTLTGAPANTGSSVGANIYNASQTAFVSGSGTPATLDGRTMQVGDIVLLTGQTATAQNGPWRIDSIASPKFTMSRPSWFRGTFTGAMLFDVQFGTANSAFIVSVMPTAISTTALATIGLDGVSAFSITKRADAATVGSNTFSGTQTFAASSPTGSAPFKFVNGGTGLNVFPTPNQCEWDGAQLYLTTNAGVRNINAQFINGAANGGTIPASSGAVGVAGQMAFDGTSLYICTATNTWRKATLVTF